MAAGDAHHQPRSGAAVAEIERMLRLQQRADAHAGDAPSAFADPIDPRTERPARFARSHDVVAFEKPLDFRLTAAEQAENEGAVRNRFVAGRARAPFERAAAAAGERAGGGIEM